MDKKERLRAVYDYLRFAGKVKTQKEFASLVGVGANNLSGAMNGDERYLTDGFFRKIADATDGFVSKNWLFSGDGEMLENKGTNKRKKIPLFEDLSTFGGYNDMVANVEDNGSAVEWIDAGDWFPNATAALFHFGDSMVEFPAGCILALKRVNDPRLIISGEVYVIETDEFRVTKQLQDRGDHFVAYSTNLEKYPDAHPAEIWNPHVRLLR